MTPTQTIKTLDELLRLMGCETLEDVVFEEAEEADFIDTQTTETGIEIIFGDRTTGYGDQFVYPFTLKEFWAGISELAGELDKRIELTGIGDNIFGEDGSSDSDELTNALDSYFGLVMGEFERTLGTDWFSDRACSQPTLNEM